MAIIQISKIQQRSGNLVDLPQLDEAEFGWASDAKRLFIGKTTPNENIEVLTAYSTIAFNQIDGAVGNLNVSNVTLADGQVLAYDGTSWTNKGGNAGGLITLGNVSNVQITGGATGFVLQTDGTGNLNWAPSGVLLSYIQNVTQANPASVTTTEDNYLVSGTKVTITNAQGMTNLNGQSYYANVTSANTFTLYSDAGLTTPVNSSGFTAYAYTSVTNTAATGSKITVGNAAVLANGAPVNFLGNVANTGLNNNTTYYITNANTTANTIQVSSTSDGGNIVTLLTKNGLTANVYQTGGRAVSTFGGGSSVGVANGTNTMVQFNANGLLAASSDFTYNDTTKLLTINGNANVGNLNASGVVTASRFISNVITGTAPLAVNSTTQVANLNAATAGTVITAAQPNITSVGTLTSLTVTGNTTSGNLLATGSVIAPIISSNSNGTGNSFRVGDDAWIGDINVTNTIVLKGQQDAANGYIVFGNADTTSTLGRAGSGPLTYNGSFVAVGNVTGANLTTAGALSVTGNANVGNIGAATGAFTANVTGANVRSNNYFYRSVATSQTAAGTVQSNAATFTTEIVEFSTVASGAGARLPTSSAGMVITIVNTSANTLNVYPATGATINSLATNAAYTHVAGATLQYVALDSTRWYTVGATFA